MKCRDEGEIRFVQGEGSPVMFFGLAIFIDYRQTTNADGCLLGLYMFISIYVCWSINTQ